MLDWRKNLRLLSVDNQTHSVIRQTGPAVWVIRYGMGIG